MDQSQLINIGDIWGNKGKSGWAKITDIQLPSYPNYDGGATGVSVRFSDTNSKGNQFFQRNAWFIICRDDKHFCDIMKDRFLKRAKSERSNNVDK